MTKKISPVHANLLLQPTYYALKKPEERKTEPLANELELEHVFGCRGHDSSRNVAYSRCGHVVYVAGNVCVVLDPLSGQQSCYCGHANDIMCMAMHPDGVIFATGEVGMNPHVCVWNCESMQSLACIDGSVIAGLDGPQKQAAFQNSVNTLCFSSKGDLLYAVTGDTANAVHVIDWRASVVIQVASGGPKYVTTCSITHDENNSMLVTAGLDHVRVWNLSKEGRLMSRGAKAVFGKRSKRTTMLCVAFASAQHVGEKERRQITLAGAIDGCIYAFGAFASSSSKIWRPELLAKCAPAHTGPIFDLRACSSKPQLKRGQEAYQGFWDKADGSSFVVSGGQDGVVKVWALIGSVHPQDKTATALELMLLTAVTVLPQDFVVLKDTKTKEDAAPAAGGKESSAQQTRARACCIKSVWPAAEGIFVGTRDNRIISVRWRDASAGDGEGEGDGDQVGEREGVGDGGTQAGSAGDSADQRVLSEGHMPGKVRGLRLAIAMHPQMQVCATAADDSTVRIWHLRKRISLAATRTTAVPTCLDFSPDGCILAVGCLDGTVTVLSVDIHDSAYSAKASLAWLHGIRGQLCVSCLRFSEILPGEPPRVYLAVATVGDGEDGGKITLYDASQVSLCVCMCVYACGICVKDHGVRRCASQYLSFVNVCASVVFVYTGTVVAFVSVQAYTHTYVYTYIHAYIHTHIQSICIYIFSLK